MNQPDPGVGYKVAEPGDTKTYVNGEWHDTTTLIRRLLVEIEDARSHAREWEEQHDTLSKRAGVMENALRELRNASPLCQDAHQFIAIAARGLGETYKRPAQPGG